MLERAEGAAEDRALNDQPYELDDGLNALATGWQSLAPALDDYDDDEVPADVVALFAARDLQ